MSRLLILTLQSGIALASLFATAQAPTLPLQALSFLSGRWTSEQSGEVQEEYWSQPMQNSMVGTFRVIQATDAVFYEFWAVELEVGKTVFKMKHFNRGLHGWEDKDDMVSLVLSVKGAQDIAFESADKSLVLRYQRKGDQLTSILRRVKDGKAQEDVFHFHLNK